MCQICVAGLWAYQQCEPPVSRVGGKPRLGDPRPSHSPTYSSVTRRAAEHSGRRSRSHRGAAADVQKKHETWQNCFLNTSCQWSVTEWLSPRREWQSFIIDSDSSGWQVRVTRMSVSEPESFQQPIKATSPDSTRLLTTLPMVVTTIDTVDTMDKANNNHNRNIPRFVIKSSWLTHMRS